MVKKISSTNNGGPQCVSQPSNLRLQYKDIKKGIFELAKTGIESGTYVVNPETGPLDHRRLLLNNAETFYSNKKNEILIYFYFNTCRYIEKRVKLIIQSYRCQIRLKITNYITQKYCLFICNPQVC